ncbi:MAG: hypothetical protein ACU83N_10535 [Gammaproteobacteria bacterium]
MSFIPILVAIPSIITEVGLITISIMATGLMDIRHTAITDFGLMEVSDGVVVITGAVMATGMVAVVRDGAKAIMAEAEAAILAAGGKAGEVGTADANDCCLPDYLQKETLMDWEGNRWPRGVVFRQRYRKKAGASVDAS